MYSCKEIFRAYLGFIGTFLFCSWELVFHFNKIPTLTIFTIRPKASWKYSGMFYNLRIIYSLSFSSWWQQFWKRSPDQMAGPRNGPRQARVWTDRMKDGSTLHRSWRPLWGSATKCGYVSRVRCNTLLLYSIVHSILV